MLPTLFRNNSLPSLILFGVMSLILGYLSWQNENLLFTYSLMPMALPDAYSDYVWILHSLLVVLCAVLFQSLVVRVNLYEKSTALPLYTFSLAIYLFPNSGLLPGIFFCLLAFFALLREPGKSMSTEAAFYSGFLLGLAALFCLPLIWLFLLLPFTQPLFGRFPLRFFLVTVLSYAIPWIYLIFWHDVTAQLQYWPVWWHEHFQLLTTWKWPSAVSILSAVFFLGTGSASVIYFLRNSGRLKIFQRNSYYAFALLFFGIIPAIGLRPSIDISFFSLMAFPHAAYMNQWLLNQRKGWVPDLVLGTFLLLALSMRMWA